MAVVDVFGPHQENRSLPVSQRDLIADDAIDLDADGLRDPVYHGDLVCLYMRDEGIETIPFPVPGQGQVKADLLARLHEIHARKSAGEQLDAVMFCWESSTLVSSFADTLRACDRYRYRETVRRWGETSDSWRLTYEIILALGQLVRDGLHVVTIAGNAGRAWVNTYTFAEELIVVGAAEADPDGEWAVSNSLITMRARSVFTVRLVTESFRPSFGYDIDEDGVMDIPLRQGSSHFRRYGSLRDKHRVLKGTSFAAPTALKRLVVQETTR